MPLLATLEGDQRAMFGASKVSKIQRIAGKTVKAGLKIAPVVAPLLPGGAIISTGAAALTASQKSTIKKAASVAKSAVKSGALTPEQARKAVVTAISNQVSESRKADSMGTIPQTAPNEGPKVINQAINDAKTNLPAWAIPTALIGAYILMRRR